MLIIVKNLSFSDRFLYYICLSFLYLLVRLFVHDQRLSDCANYDTFCPIRLTLVEKIQSTQPCQAARTKLELSKLQHSFRNLLQMVCKS